MTEKMDAIKWSVYPGEIEDAAGSSYTDQFAISIYTYFLYDVYHPECRDSYCSYTITLEGWDFGEVRDTLTFYIWEPPTNCEMHVETAVATSAQSLTE
mmetsp:Transcript_22840/g.11038  ORF Transcript_22840/g.11038 Transcript_22840/m.11038 type:complete len:98 (-) Transcript_22840:637-930(-)